MEEVDRFGKHSEVCAPGSRIFETSRSFLKSLIEIGETFLPKGNGCDCFLVQGASFPQSNSGLEHNLIKFRVATSKWVSLEARWTG